MPLAPANMNDARLVRTALSRRRFLGALALGAGAGLLAACGSATGTATPSAVPSKPAGGANPNGEPARGAQDVSELFNAKPKLATLEEELALPDSIVQAAIKEGSVSAISSWTLDDPLRKFFAAFKKRYPGIEVNYQTAEEAVRTVRTLTEFKAGRNLIDVPASISGFILQYQAANALVPLNDLPAFANYEAPLVDSTGGWASYQVNVWGLAYNTDNVKGADIPKSWEDLTNAKWKGRIGLVDRPQLWAMTLWKEWGPARATDFLKKLFATNPQRRNEGVDAVIGLLAAGEMDIVLPAQTHRAEQAVGQHAPLGWLALEPFMVAPGDIEIIKGPHPNAAKVFVNWLLSREGNDAYYQAVPVIPAHPLLRSQRKYQGMFADAFVGKQASVRQQDDEEKYLAAVNKVWRELWLGG